MLSRRQRLIRKKMRRVLGKIGKQRGKDNEDKVLTAFVGRPEGAIALPKWFFGISVGTVGEDRAGIDFSIDTDVGPVPLQVKSSETGKRAFMAHPAYDGSIAIVVIRPQDTSSVIRLKICSAIGEIRKQRRKTWPSP